MDLTQNQARSLRIGSFFASKILGFMRVAEQNAFILKIMWTDGA